MKSQSRRGGKPSKIAIAAKSHAKEAPRVVRDLVEWLGERGIETCLESVLAAKIGTGASFSLDKMPRDVDMFVVLGGDGTLLSVARAMAVLHYLVESCGIPDDQCVVAGHGQYSPVAENSDNAGKARNRRVEIVVHK